MSVIFEAYIMHVCFRALPLLKESPQHRPLNRKDKHEQTEILLRSWKKKRELKKSKCDFKILQQINYYLFFI